jgi:hypothetical protein
MVDVIFEMTPEEEAGFKAVCDHDATVDLSEFIEMCKAEILSAYGDKSAVLDDSAMTITRSGDRLIVRGTVWPIKEIT